MSDPSVDRYDRSPGARLVAFLAASSGSGRTSTVANVAWILANAGARVLVIDWSSEASSVQEYLEPFHVETMPLDVDLVRAYSSSLVGEGAKPRSVQRYGLPGGRGRIDVIGDPSTGEAPLPVGTVRQAPEAFAELRAQLRRSPYDYVLFDAPPGSDDVLATAIAILCDKAVVCFLPRGRAITHAAELSRLISRLAPNYLDVIPVVTMFNDTYDLKAEQSRNAVWAAFAAPPATGDTQIRYTEVVEIPYHPYGALFDPILAVLADDRPDQSLTSAYVRVAEIVVAGFPGDDRPALDFDVPHSVRARYRMAFRLAPVIEPDRIVIACLPNDRIWGEWVQAELGQAGMAVRDLAAAGEWLAADQPPALIVINSTRLPGTTLAGDIDALLDRVRHEQRQMEVVQLMLDDDSVELPRIAASIVLGRIDETEARARLLAYFGLPNRGTMSPHRFPAEPPTVLSLPARLPDLRGRDAECDAVRDALLDAGPGQVTFTVAGPDGVGKSALVTEYAHRFAFDYDLVWWVPAHDRQAVLTSLAGLAMELRSRGVAESPFAGALEVLEVARDDRWLMIYDGADPAALAGLLPNRPNGHTLITTVTPVTSGLVLGGLNLQDSREFLLAGVVDLTPAAADRIAEMAGRLPLALEIAARWLTEMARADQQLGASAAEAVAVAVERLTDHLATSIGAEGATAPSATIVRALIDVLIETLRLTRLGGLAVLLGEFCACLSPEGTRLHLLRSGPVRTWLADVTPDATQLRSDQLELDRVLWTGTRCGLFTVDWGRQAVLRMHPLVQDVVRGRLAPETAEARQAQVLDCLAGYAPTESDDERSDRAVRFAELQRHLGRSGALRSTAEQVRRWLVNHVRYLYTEGDAGVWRATLDQVDELLEQWTERFGPTDELRCRLANQLANLHRALGDHARALMLDAKVLATQRRTLSLTHPRTLMTARGRAADLRGLGRFADALSEDETTWTALRDELGEDHPQTRSAANNLALALHLAGETAHALSVEEDNYARVTRLFGSDSPPTWWSLCSVGVYRRELGRYDAAAGALRLTLENVRRLRPPNHPEELRVVWQYAITLRCQGHPRSALERTTRAVRGYQDAEGPDHPNTLACRMSLAADYAALRRGAHAIDTASKVLDEYLRGPENHPFVSLCQVALGRFFQMEHHWDEAVATSESGWEGLRAAVGATHPWSLAAQINHAGVLAATGRHGLATDLVRRAHGDCVEYLGSAHPHTRAASANLRLAGRDDRRWRYIDIDVPQT